MGSCISALLWPRLGAPDLASVSQTVHPAAAAAAAGPGQPVSPALRCCCLQHLHPVLQQGLAHSVQLAQAALAAAGHQLTAAVGCAQQSHRPYAAVAALVACAQPAHAAAAVVATLQHVVVEMEEEVGGRL